MTRFIKTQFCLLRSILSWGARSGLMITMMLIMNSYPSQTSAIAFSQGEGGVEIEPCQEAVLDGRGYEFENVVLPAEAEEVEYEDVDQITGDVDDIYSGSYDTALDNWYADVDNLHFPCPFTIGGTIPTDLPEPDMDGVEDEETVSQQLDMLGDEIAGIVNTQVQGYIDIKDAGPIFAGTYAEPLCQIAGASPISCVRFLDPVSPFGGRDIVFVHGLDTTPLYEKIVGNPEAETTWPANKDEFVDDSGYWKKGANAYWGKHINNFLKSKGARNRYLVVAYASTQTMEFAVHAMLTQISDAMTGKTDGVKLLDPLDPRGKTGFGVGGLVIISHSTGGLVSDVALSVANKSGPGGLFSFIGNVSFISSHTKVHVALAPALSGSHYATAVIALAFSQTFNPTVCQLAILSLEVLSGAGGNPNWATLFNNGCSALFQQLSTSILRDLVPQVAQLVWGPLFVNDTPVPVLIVAGGHHSTHYPLKFFLQRGFDDGVVTMDSACAHSPSLSFVAFWPTGFIARPILIIVPVLNPKLFDMGMQPVGRATLYFAEQTLEWSLSPFYVPRAAGACTPYKSPWGMLEPVFAPLPGTSFYKNHYSYVQTAEDHYEIVDGNSSPAGEDVRVILSNDVYANGLVNNSMKSLQVEEVKGKKITFKVKIGPIKIKKVWWIWKRTYHRLKGWETLTAGDYVYRYVLK